MTSEERDAIKRLVRPIASELATMNRLLTQILSVLRPVTPLKPPEPEIEISDDELPPL
jgi:hypothetical protein